MERARTYKTSGRLRILFGYTLAELLGLIGVTLLAFRLSPGSLPGKGLAAMLLLGLSVLGLKLWRRALPGRALAQLLCWLAEADGYLPGLDPDPRPLVVRDSDAPR